MAYGDVTFLADTTYQGEDYRTAYEAALQQGVFGAGDLAVTFVSGRNYSVAPGVAYIAGDNYVGQGLYRCPLVSAEQSDNFAGGGIPAPGANPRVHQIVARVYEHESDATGLRLWRLEVVPGAATAGATLDNRNGAGALPNNAIILLDVHQTAAGVLTTRDRRPWARGAEGRRTRSMALGALGVAAGGGVVSMDVANFQQRLELSGKPLDITVELGGINHNGAAGTSGLLYLAVFINAVELVRKQIPLQRDYQAAINAVWRDVDPGIVGSGLFDLRWAASGQSINSGAMATGRDAFTVSERLRQLANNGTT